MNSYNLSDQSNMCPAHSDALRYSFYVSKLLRHTSYLIVLHCTFLAAISVAQTPLGTFNTPPTHCTDTRWTHALHLNIACSIFGLCAVHLSDLGVIGTTRKASCFDILDCACFIPHHFSFTSTDFVLYHLPYVFLMLASWLISYLGTFSF
jgi:hypothetical protein